MSTEARPEGFPKAERVRKSDEFTHILKNGRRERGRLVTVYWTTASDPGDTSANRVGVAAGKKLGSAAVRNRLKRHIREAYRRNKRELPCRGIAMVFLASPRMIGRPWKEVQEDIRGLLHRVAGSDR